LKQSGESALNYSASERSRYVKIVFSSSLTIADAIAAAAKLKSILKVTEFEQGMSAACSEMSEWQAYIGA
jgi:hypothetical protein